MRRKDALILGLKFFEPDKPCLVCGGMERYASTGGCRVCLLNGQRNREIPRKIFGPDQMPTTRAQALEMQSKFYKPTTPCRNGHLSKRYTRSCICVLCNRAAARKSMGMTPDKTKRAAGLAKYEAWVYPDQVQRLAAFERQLLSERGAANPAEAPVRPVPIMPGDRHPDDYDMK